MLFDERASTERGRGAEKDKETDRKTRCTFITLILYGPNVKEIYAHQTDQKMSHTREIPAF